MKKIGFIGGDLRIVKLAELFKKDSFEVYTYGLEKAIFEENIVKTSLEEVTRNNDIIISSIPFSNDNEKINTPFSKEEIKIKEVFSKIDGKKFISGALKQNILDLAKEHRIEAFDVLQEDSLAILNAIPTAEGAIQIAMEETRNNYT